MINKIKKIFTKKRIIWGAIILAVLVGGYFLFFNKKTTEETLAVHPADFLQQVSASGKIIAKENLDLSFEEPGQVSMVNVKVGQTVRAGQLLASQNTGQLQAQVLGMQAGIQLEQARLEQLLAGKTPEDIQTAQDAIYLAEQNIKNAYDDLKHILDNASTSIFDAHIQVSYIQKTYFNGNDAEDIKVQSAKNTIQTALNDSKRYVDIAKSSLRAQDWDSAAMQMITNLNKVYANVAIVRQQCEVGIYYSTVLAADKTALDSQKTSINTALAAVTGSQSDIAAYNIELNQAKDALKVKEAAPRTSDIAVHRAQLAQAKANLQDVLARLNKKRMYSPINGIVSVVNAKVGSIISSQEVAISVISKSNFQIESYIPQINISLIEVGQETEVTLDAYGDAVFLAKVISIDPAETIKDGVSTYKVMLEFADNNDSRIKSGMTGNIVVTTEKKSDVISVPQGIVKIIDGKKIVKVKEGDETIERQVETGMISSSGNIEIISGLKDGDVVVLN